LLAYLIVRLGPARIAGELHGLSGILPAVLLLTGPKYVLQTIGWRLVLPRSMRPGWGDSVSATVTGDALGYLTWAGPFTGEPIRALLTRHAAPVGASIAAGAAERAMYNVTAAILIAAVMLERLSTSHDEGWRTAAWVAAAGVSVALVVVLRRRARAGASVPRTPPARSRLSMKVARSLEGLRPFWQDRRRLMPLLAALCLAQHALLVTECYIMLGALGAAPSLREAFVFEALTKVVNTAGLAVPGRLGISEGGSALLAGSLGFAASYGLSLALMRRVRALIWAVVGLVLLPITEHRARRALS
jgi:hypothetical protein